MIYLEHGGRKTRAVTPSLALYYWYSARCLALTAGSLHGDCDLESPVQIEELPENAPQPGQDLLWLAVAACEREFGKTPIWDQGQDNQDQSWQLLQWLSREGDVTRLETR